jgi:hypothetical protein
MTVDESGYPVRINPLIALFFPSLFIFILCLVGCTSDYDLI